VPSNRTGVCARLQSGAVSSTAGGGSLTQNLFQTGFDASWEIDPFGGVRWSIEAADADLAASQEDLRDALVSLLAEVARNYVEMRGLQRRLAIAQRNNRCSRRPWY
jgi:outer membrane protein TolC